MTSLASKPSIASGSSDTRRGTRRRRPCGCSFLDLAFVRLAALRPPSRPLRGLPIRARRGAVLRRALRRSTRLLRLQAQLLEIPAQEYVSPHARDRPYRGDRWGHQRDSREEKAGAAARGGVYRWRGMEVING